MAAAVADDWAHLEIDLKEPTSRFFRLPAPSPPRTFYQTRTNAALIFTMKFRSAILLCALLAAFLALTTAAEERAKGGKKHIHTGNGCPDIVACVTSCRKKGHTMGACIPLLNTCMCVKAI
ncbi:hypothetical protein MTO96_048781 [Rhipicephalus appendiculatus]